MENVWKPAQDLHGTIVKAVEYEESRGKHKDLKDRLIRELPPYGQYVNPLAILSSEVYGLNLQYINWGRATRGVLNSEYIVAGLLTIHIQQRIRR